MKERECSKCGTTLSPGSLAYVASVRVFADFDGVLVEPEEQIDRHLNRVLEQIQEADAAELEKEVYEAFNLFLCKPCRDRFVQEALHSSEDRGRGKRISGETIH